MAKAKRKINLLPNKGDTILNQFFSWALTIGRLLIILTETLALSVFLYRFSLDMKIIDLHDKIKTESIIVENFKDGEITYRNLQARLTSVKDYGNNPDKTLLILKDIVELGRNKVTFKSVIISTETIEIEVQSSSANSLSLFTKELNAYPEVEELNIERVENKTSSALVTVAISGSIKGAKKAVSPTPGGQP